MAKGSSFEREVCKQLSLWWTGSKDDSCFWRTANSGGRATVRGRKGKKTQGHCGDICATGKVGSTLTKVFTFELKRGYNRASLSEIMDRPKHLKPSTYEQWIEQAEAAAERAGTPFWLIIHRRDKRECMVTYTSSLPGILSGKARAGLSGKVKPILKIETKELSLIQTSLENFLGCVTKKDVLDLYSVL